MKTSGISSGLDALLSARLPSEENTSRLQEVSIANLVASPYQPRKFFSEAALMDLSNSIRIHGVLQPILAKPAASEQFYIIAGERRWRAAQMAGLKTLPVIVCEVDDEAALAFGLIENLQREDLNPIESALAMRRLIDEFGFSHEAVAEKVGKPRSSVSNLLRLLNLEALVQEFLESEKIEIGHAKVLLALKGRAQETAAEEIIAKNLNVRQTEELVKKILNPAPEKAAEELPLSLQRKIEDCQNALAKLFPVSIKLNSSGKGRVSIPVESVTELEWLVEKLRE